MRKIIAVLLPLTLLIDVPAAASTDYMSQAVGADELRPGDFQWFPRLASVRSSGAISVIVSVQTQRAYVYQDGLLLGVSTIFTGKPGKETPLGEFTILQKRIFHRSNLYSNAPMPFMQRLTWDGIAIHAGDLPGYPASHGCIRLPHAFARTLFDMTEMGGSVVVVAEHDASLPVDMRDREDMLLPKLIARTEGLGGTAFDVVTLRAPPPAAEASAWQAAPARAIVQPLDNAASQ